MRWPEFGTARVGHMSPPGHCRRAFRRRGPGVTVVELLVVVACICVLMIPVWNIYRAGRETATQGMEQLDMGLEGRRILQQVRSDLRHSCYILFRASPRIDFAFMLRANPSTPPHTSFEFLRFPGMGEISDCVPSVADPLGTGEAFRKLSQITYLLEPNRDPGKVFLQLVREERVQPSASTAATHPGGYRRTVLSHRVSFFSIRPHLVQAGTVKQHFFWVQVQLAERGRGQTFAYTAGDRITSRPAGLQVVEFFDVVRSDFFHSVWNQEGMKRNWHTFLEDP